MSESTFPGWHGTTIVSVRKGNKVVVAGDGHEPQVIAGADRVVDRRR